jgi:HAD superfamily hydrolase (TIGR01509 family)
MTLRALLLDVDGTLVDTNEAHVLAWLEAFKAFDFRVGHDRIAEEIGKGGDLLVPDVLGRDVDEKEGEKLRKAHGDFYKKRIERDGASLFPGVDELLSAIRAAGLRVAIATSSKKNDIELLERAIGRTFASMVDEVATGDDAEVSKPAPHVVEAACKKLGVDPLACALVGDSLFDTGAARRAGAASIAVLQGFVSRPQFIEVGTRFIANDLGHLRAELARALAACSQGEIRFDQTVIDAMMGQAIEAARAGVADGEAPIGAALFDGSGALLATGYNRACKTHNVTMHAEMDAFRRAAEAGKEIGKGAVLVSTLEPCVMCLGASMVSSIDVVIYGLEAPADGGTERIHAPRSPEDILPRIRGGVRAAEARQLFVDWLAQGPDPKQRPYAEQLLAETTPEGKAREKTEIKIES